MLHSFAIAAKRNSGRKGGRVAERMVTGRRAFLAAAGAAALGMRTARAAAPVTELLRLDRNESPLGPGPRVRALLADAGALAGRYPDASGEPVRRALAAHHGVPAECVVPTCGSVEGIELALRELLREGERVATPAPVFQLVPPLAGQAGGVVVPVPVRADGAPDLDALLAVPRARVLFVVNPHNPTGGACARAELERLVARRPAGCCVVVDEAYLAYGGGEAASVLALAARTPDLVVLRTFSKAHGLAGLRIGYAVAEPSLAARLARLRLRNGVGLPAETVVPAALADTGHLARVTDLNARARDVMTQGLARLGWRPFGSRANFVLADVPRAAEVEARLASRGILVHRPADRPDSLRVTTGTLAQVRRFLDALK